MHSLKLYLRYISVFCIFDTYFKTVYCCSDTHAVVIQCQHPLSRSRSNSTHYRAAVVEYQPEGSPWEDSGPEIISKNLVHYLNYISNASANAVDIIVFPEYGMTSLGIPRDREAAKPFLLRVPPIGSNPCREPTNPNISPQVVTLSCAAQSGQIYLVVNIGEIRNCSSTSADCPPDGVFQFNTNVAFDRDGTIVAKYEKANLYFEDQFDKPNPIGMSSFQTDFGVEFGLFTCFDIIFYNPATKLVEEVGLSHFIFPTAWVDELPFLTAIQAQASWAHGTNVNLLASGYHSPIGGQLGSGIYSGVDGAVIYTFNSESGSKMLMGELPIVLEPRSEFKSNNPSTPPVSNISAFHSYLREDLTNYTTRIIDVDLDWDRICTRNGFCCEIVYQMSQDNVVTNSLENYRLIAFNGSRTVAAKTAEYEWQVCAIVRCLNASLASCSENLVDDATPQLPNFERVHLQAKFDIRGGDLLPSFNALDTAFDLISPHLFKIQVNQTIGEFSVNSTALAGIRIKTLAVINKLFREEIVLSADNDHNPFKGNDYMPELNARRM